LYTISRSKHSYFTGTKKIKNKFILRNKILLIFLKKHFCKGPFYFFKKHIF